MIVQEGLFAKRVLNSCLFCLFNKVLECSCCCFVLSCSVEARYNSKKNHIIAVRLNYFTSCHKKTWGFETKRPTFEVTFTVIH